MPPRQRADRLLVARGLFESRAKAQAAIAAGLAKGLPLAEHVSSLLAGVLGGAQAHDLVAEAGARATSAGLPLRDVLLASDWGLEHDDHPQTFPLPPILFGTAC